MKTRTFQALAMAMSAGTGQAPSQERASTLVGYRLNGQGWKSLDSKVQALYLHGLHDGVGYTLRFLESSKNSMSNTHAITMLKHVIDLPALTVRDLAAKISQLYSDPLNLEIPVADMLMPASLLCKGVESSEVEKILREKRT